MIATDSMFEREPGEKNPVTVEIDARHLVQNMGLRVLVAEPARVVLRPNDASTSENDITFYGSPREMFHLYVVARFTMDAADPADTADKRQRNRA